MSRLDSREIERQRYIAAAMVALSKHNWRQLISVAEHILRLEKAIEDQKCRELKSE